MNETMNGEQVPRVEDWDEYRDFFEHRSEIGKPTVLVNAIRGRNWSHVICDMDYDDSGREKLTENAVEEINAICHEFEDEELRNKYSYGDLSARHGVSFMSFPEMRPAVARRFAEEIAPVVMDESNREDRDE